MSACFDCSDMNSESQDFETTATDERRVYVEQIGLLYTSTAKGLVATIINSLIVVFVLWDKFDRTVLAAWASANMAMALVAAFTVFLFRKDQDKEKNIEKWRRVSLVRLFFSGLAGGSLAFFFTKEHPAEVQIFYYAVLCGMTAGASAVYAIKKEMFWVYAVPEFLPMAFRFFSYEGSISYAMGTMGLLFFGIMLSSVRSMYASTLDALVLRFKNETLAKRIFEEKQQTEHANEQLTLTRDQLWGEMKLAQKIQTVLLPKKPHIPGYEIAAFMEPASEVGGDYYDVINVGSYNWLVIGDVSGHGFSAGLVMMMTQTSILTVLANKPDRTPSRLLEEVNNAIVKNIQKLGEDKYMTITVLAVQDEGQVVYSGLHQDILVFRAADKSVETISTEGIWIGILENLRGLLRDDSFRLLPGDTMLLFTDGITEAQLPGDLTASGESEMFGQSRLESLLAENGEKPSAALKDAIVEYLRGCNIDDDTTIIVVKRKNSLK